MGRRMTGHKTTGTNGTETATFYKVTSQCRNSWKSQPAFFAPDCVKDRY